MANKRYTPPKPRRDVKNSTSRPGALRMYAESRGATMRMYDQFSTPISPDSVLRRNGPYGGKAKPVVPGMKRGGGSVKKRRK